KLHQAIANHYDLPFVNLHDTPADATLHHVIDVPEYIRFQVIPFKEEGGRTILATADPSAALVAWAEERYGKNYAFVITSPFDIYWHIDSYFADNLDTISRNRLWEIMPEKSARIVLTRAQQLQLLTVILAMVILVTLFPNGFTASLLLLINFFYFITIVLKCMLFYIGWDYRPGSVLPSKKLPPMDESTLPVYTLLIPVYDEVAALPRLIESLNALDYPKAKLDIKFIVERDDEKTIHAFKSLKPSGQYELIYVPYSLPQTKPKACNYALHFARGKYVTIYDAEDSPDPLQLKKAVHWFAQQPENVICLQARLNYYNRNHNLLTRLFAIEYAAWFDFMLPGLRKLRIPIPLGGTSNHLHLEKLRNLGEWDPYNVTEDADLGIRLALQGYETDMLDSLTAEEAPIGLKAWMNQRTRWVRGYMQTWLVHMRHPVRLFRELDYNAFWGFQFFIG
ncbi:MAG: glycosyltransferase family 2 protein, partial [Rickettsiales bacterium]